jgi:NADPH:quinone reductase-like Zn-dependent oxidoreductase
MEKDEVVRVVIDRAGGYEQLQVVHLDAAAALEPTLGGDEVRVEAVAVGVNYADVCVRMGLYASAARYVGWPITPGIPLGHFVLLECKKS